MVFYLIKTPISTGPPTAISHVKVHFSGSALKWAFDLGLHFQVGRDVNHHCGINDGH